MTLLRCARMQDGCLHKGDIISDVQDYEPAGSHLSAEGLIGGFPCQVGNPAVLWMLLQGFVTVEPYSQVLPRECAGQERCSVSMTVALAWCGKYTDSLTRSRLCPSVFVDDSSGIHRFHQVQVVLQFSSALNGTEGFFVFWRMWPIYWARKTGSCCITCARPGFQDLLCQYILIAFLSVFVCYRSLGPEDFPWDGARSLEPTLVPRRWPQIRDKVHELKLNKIFLCRLAADFLLLMLTLMMLAIVMIMMMLMMTMMT